MCLFGILTSVHIILSILFDRNIWPSFLLVHSYKVSFCMFDFFKKESAIVGGYVSIYQKRFFRESQLTDRDKFLACVNGLALSFIPYIVG